MVVEVQLHFTVQLPQGVVWAGKNKITVKWSCPILN